MRRFLSEHMIPAFMLTWSWINSFNPDWIVKGLSMAASIYAILAYRSTIRKNRNK